MPTLIHSTPIPLSKSILNRLFILSARFEQWSYLSQFYKTQQKSLCDDSLFLVKSLLDFHAGSNVFYVGHGATTLRFFSIFIAAQNKRLGEFEIHGSTRLFSRPQDQLYEILHFWNVHFEIKQNETDTILKIIKDLHLLDFEKRPNLKINVEQSAQFYNAVLLCTPVAFHNKIEIYPQDNIASQSYIELTKKLIIVPAAKLTDYYYSVDASSIVSMITAVMYSDYKIFKLGPISFNEIEQQQGDWYFLDILRSLGVMINRLEEHYLLLSWNKLIAPSDFSINLKSTPDLFPALCMLFSITQGSSIITGIENLAHKESQRLYKSIELLDYLGVSYQLENELQNPLLKITGIPDLLGKIPQLPIYTFDPDQDHRMAFAASCIRLNNMKFNIQRPEVVSKSFKQYWVFLEEINAP